MKNSKPEVIVTQSRIGDVSSDVLAIRHTPLITTERLAFDESVLERAFDWLVLTSPNAVDHFMPYLSRVRYKKLASIGRKTSESMKAHGLKVDFEPSGYSQEGFMEEFTPQKGESVLYPVSENARPLMYGFLLEAGMEVERIRLYRPLTNFKSFDEIARLLEDGPYAITFSSPSGVHSFMKRFDQDLPAGIVIAAIGHVTKEALQKYDIDSIQPGNETLESMITLLENGIDRGAGNEF